ncbi:acetyltransferase [Micromonospora sp. FIMYZ51]|uniref:acetyltransferase n=1 Tax=Micromonospora sp. FIMYZ51 TaxID=3051832 RepID=UPI00311FF8B5
MRSLVIVGAGGFARETVAAVRAVNDLRPSWRLLGFLDDDPGLHGTERVGLPVLGGTDRLAELGDPAIVVCVGNPRDHTVRRRVVHRLALPAERYATIVHPGAHLGTACSVGPGTVLLAGVVLTADVTVGGHVAVMPHAVLTHDAVVSDHVTIASGARLGGGTVLRPGAYLGAGALIREGVTVGEGSLVGMGAVVLRDVPPGEVWAGNPARRLRGVEPPTPPAGAGRRTMPEAVGS